MSKSLSINVVALCALGVLTYGIKQRVVELDGRLRSVQKEIAQYQESIHILNAEWSYLTRPSRLQALVDEHLAMDSSDGLSLVGYEDVFERFDPDLCEVDDVQFEEMAVRTKPLRRNHSGRSKQTSTSGRG